MQPFLFPNKIKPDRNNTDIIKLKITVLLLFTIFIQCLPDQKQTQSRVKNYF